MEDRSFSAIKTTPLKLTGRPERFELSGNGELMLTNRNDTLSPILTLIENGKVKSTLDKDVRYTKGYESCRIWEIGNLRIAKHIDPH